MRFIVGLVPAAAAASVDVCTRLCDFDGLSICTEGSEQVNDTCSHYYYRGDSRDYCYALTAANCPTNGRPVRPADVNDLIADRVASADADAPLTTEAPIIEYTTIEPTAPPARPPYESWRPIIEAIAQLPSSYGQNNPIDGDSAITKIVIRRVRDLYGSPDASSALDMFLKTSGPDLLRLARANMRARPVLMRPLFVLAGFACTSLPESCQELLDQSGTGAFFSTNAELLLNAIKSYHYRNWGQRWYPTMEEDRTESAMMWGFAGPLSAAFREMRESSELRAISFVHRLFAYTVSTDSLAASPVHPHVEREHMFVQSSGLISGASVESLRRTVTRVEMLGEAGIGEGNVRDYFTGLIQNMMKPEVGLFRVNPEASYAEVSPNVAQVPDYASHLAAVGRLMALSITQNQAFGFRFPSMFYAHILGQRLTLEDIKEDEPQLYSSMMNFMALTAEDLEMGYEILGQEVTFENREALIEAKISALIPTEMLQYLDMIKQGFLEVIPWADASVLRAVDLKHMLGGNSDFNVDELVPLLTFGNGYTLESPQVQWLITLLRELSNEDRLRFLRFTTSSAQVPIGGFAALSKPILIMKLADSNNLPSAGTCFNTFKLPEYATEEILRQKVRIALANVEAGLGLS